MEESKKPHYDVIITTPGHSMNQLYVLSLVGTIKELEKEESLGHIFHSMLPTL